MWMPRGSGCLTEGEMGYDNSSRMEFKCGHQWFTDAHELENFSYKKQAFETVSNCPISGISNLNASLWENTSCFQPAPTHSTNCLFGSEPAMDQNIPSTGNMSFGRKDFEIQFENDPSVGLTMGGPYERSMNNLMSLGMAYSAGDGNAVPTRPSLMSIDCYLDKANGNFISTGNVCDKGSESIHSMAGRALNKGDGGLLSTGHGYNREPGNFFSISTVCSKDNADFVSMGSAYTLKVDDNAVSIGSACCKRDTNILGHNSYGKGEGHTISFGGFQDEAEINSSGNYLMVMRQPLDQSLGALGQRDWVHRNSYSVVGKDLVAASRTDSGDKNKVLKLPKKVASNNFPSNVKSLLSTGMLDGVPVKYVSWSREKNLKGAIKGSGYLCSCKDCNMSKSLNAYEFERHAGCKTKHPNNHIYFENGKTIYAVVQELKSTPQEFLFEAIQSTTGSPVNHKNFCIWKASYQAATRELQRIYGKDEGMVLS